MKYILIAEGIKVISIYKCLKEIMGSWIVQ
jgi:hypothetical protein